MHTVLFVTDGCWCCLGFSFSRKCDFFEFICFYFSLSQKLSNIFNLIRRSKRIIMVEIEKNALHALVTSEIVDDDHVQVFSKEKC